MPVCFQSHQVIIATMMRNAPWATLMMFMTPNTSVRPDAISA